MGAGAAAMAEGDSVCPKQTKESANTKGARTQICFTFQLHDKGHERHSRAHERALWKATAEVKS
jgi:hypothetical protein